MPFIWPWRPDPLPAIDASLAEIKATLNQMQKDVSDMAEKLKTSGQDILDKITAEDAAIDKAVAAIAGFRQQIADLQAAVAAGTFTPDQLDALAADIDQHQQSIADAIAGS